MVNLLKLYRGKNMKYYEEEIKIESEPNLTFRFKNISPVKILSMANEVLMSTQQGSQREHFLSEALEATEVKIGETWLPVKEGENYYPASIRDNLNALFQLTNLYFEKVIKPVFTGSDESQKELK